jgi:hypothetical protein
LLANEVLWLVLGLVIIKLIILAAIVIRYKISKRLQRPVFMFKSMLIVIAIFAAIVFIVWPSALESILFALSP